MIVCVALTGGGLVDPRWGRADRLAVATVKNGVVTDWQEHEVKWGSLRQAGSERAHHARVARFLRQQHVDVVLAHHMGDEMLRILRTMKIAVHLGVAGNAREAVEALAAQGAAPVGLA
jgi:predicted Fe-Mo cluster-binding NifX family protein